MDQAEFTELYSRYIAAMREFFAEAEKTSALIAKFAAGPASGADRMMLVSQEIAEQNAHFTYLGLKRALFDSPRINSAAGSVD